MRALNSFLTTLLLISLLPWGAFHDHAQARDVQVAVATVQDATQDLARDIPVIRPVPVEGTKAVAKARTSRCRTATLTGAGCGGDHAIFAALPALPQPERDAMLVPADTTRRHSHNEAPPRSPPRLG